jgi:hypothetical protein
MVNCSTNFQPGRHFDENHATALTLSRSPPPDQRPAAAKFFRAERGSK